MPKRKRPQNDEDDAAQTIRRRKHAVQIELTKSTKSLHRALKTAKGFERQKLGKRLKHAITKNELDEIKRINHEIEALKALDVDIVTTAQLHRSLLKVKEFKDSELLPDEVRSELPKPAGSEEEVKALHNVTSNMCNAKVVKEEIKGLVERMYGAMGIPILSKESKAKKVETAIDGKSKQKRKEEEEPEIHHKATLSYALDQDIEEAENDSWPGLGSSEENDVSEKPNEDDLSFSDEDLKELDELLGASSDEESFHEEDWLPKTETEQTRFSFSPEPSLSLSLSESQSSSPEPDLIPEPALELPKKKKAAPKPKSDPIKPGNSTFLPSLMGGYWSGSESSASDLEDSKPVRKNRPGQMARRAIAEKKFGQKANHILSGQGPVAERRKDDGWDAKRGATDGRPYTGKRDIHNREGQQGMNRKERRMNRKERRKLQGGTGENAAPIKPREMVKKRDDVGVLHPSWQAAKKAKEMKKTATFEGKKVVF